LEESRGELGRALKAREYRGAVGAKGVGCGERCPPLGKGLERSCAPPEKIVKFLLRNAVSDNKVPGYQRQGAETAGFYGKSIWTFYEAAES